MNEATPVRRRRAMRCIAGTLVWLAASISLAANGPFTVHRAGAPSELDASPSHASVPSSPFEDAVGTLDDGIDWYYGVLDVFGRAVAVTIAKNDALGTVLVHFDDTAGPTPQGEAIEALDVLTASNGTFDALLDGLDPSSDPEAEKVAEAWSAALAALVLLRNGDPADDPSAIDNDLASAIGELVAALEDPGAFDPTDLAELIDDLLDAARLVAVHHIALAASGCGACSEGGPSELCDAEAALASGDAARTALPADPVAAVALYGAAISQAIDALADCA